MNLELSAEDRAFRDEVRAFLKQSLPEYLREAGRNPTSVFADKEHSLAWQRILHARGWVAPAWPKDYGGPGWNVMQPAPGWHQWTAPSGRTYTQEPKRYPA